MRSYTKKILLVLVIFFMFFVMAFEARAQPANSGTSVASPASKPIVDKNWSYSPDFLNSLAKQDIQTVLLDPSQHKIIATLKNGQTKTASYPPSTEESIVEKLSAQAVPISVAEEKKDRGPLLGMLFSLFLVGGLIAFFVIMNRKNRKNAFGDGHSFEDQNGTNDQKSRRFSLIKKKPEKIEFDPNQPPSDDTPTKPIPKVAGCDEAVEEVNEFKAFLVNHQRFRKLGAKMPKGVLLYGPPGTGKTLLVKNLAQSCGVSFFSVSGSEFVERYVGVGAERVRNLFKKARQAPNGAVVFIDEIDAIGRSRSLSGGNDERETTLNQLLVEMDGFDASDKIIVMAATNRLDVLDAALLRAGRFSRKIHVGLPSEKGRAEILAVHTKGKPLAEDVDLAGLAAQTFGSSGATLAETVNEAAIMAAREDLSEIHQRHFIEGNLRVIAGPEKKNAIWGAGERETIAWHEAGHVLAAELFRGHEKAQRATIRPRGEAGGLAIYGQSDKMLLSADDVYGKLVVLLGGRAAEQIHRGVVSSGASNDLQRANQIAKQAIQEWGFAPGGSLLSSGSPESTSEKGKERVDNEVDQMVTDAYDRAFNLLFEHINALQRMAELLLQKEDVVRHQIVEIIGPIEETSWNVDAPQQKIENTPEIEVEASPVAPLPDASMNLVPTKQPQKRNFKTTKKRLQKHGRGYIRAIQQQYNLHRKKDVDANG